MTLPNLFGGPKRKKENQRKLPKTFWPKTRELDFSRICGFRRMIEDHEFFHFMPFPAKTNDSILRKSRKSRFLDHLGFFPKNQPNQIFPEKSGSVTFDPLWSPNFIKKNQKKLMSQFWEKCVTDRRTDGRTETDEGDSIGHSLSRVTNKSHIAITST